MYFIAGAGVKQGDPSSMVIFVICFDPLRWINSLLAPIGYYLFGYCDDVGIACKNLLISWPIIKKRFHIAGRISGLWLNGRKCVIVPLSDTGLDELRRWVASNLPDWSDFKVETRATHLGFF